MSSTRTQRAESQVQALGVCLFWWERRKDTLRAKARRGQRTDSQEEQTFKGGQGICENRERNGRRKTVREAPFQTALHVSSGMSLAFCEGETTAGGVHAGTVRAPPSVTAKTGSTGQVGHVRASEQPHSRQGAALVSGSHRCGYRGGRRGLLGAGHAPDREGGGDAGVNTRGTSSSPSPKVCARYTCKV